MHPVPDAQRRSAAPHVAANRQQKYSATRRASEEVPLADATLVQATAQAQAQLQTQQVVGSLCATIVTFISWLLVICCFPWSLFFVVKVVNEYERVVVLRLGKLVRKQPLAAGLHVIIPCLDSVRKVDMRVRSFCMPLSDLITADSMVIRVDTIIYYRVHDPVLVTTNVEDADKSTREASATVCRNAVASKALNQILADRQELCTDMEEELSRATADWGIAIQRVEVNDVQLSEELHRAMSLEKEARQNVRVKLIAAEGEAAIAGALSNAAAKLAKSPMALQLRYLQTLQSLTASSNNINTVLVPLPLELGRMAALTNMHMGMGGIGGIGGMGGMGGLGGMGVMGGVSGLPECSPSDPSPGVVSPAPPFVRPKSSTLSLSTSATQFPNSPRYHGEKMHATVTQSNPDR